MKKIPIRIKLVGGFLVLLVLVCSGLGWIAYDRAKGASLAQVRENIQIMAEDGARLVRSRLDFYLVGLEGIANRDVVRSLNWDRQQLVLERETERMKYLGMGVVDASGQAQYPDGTTADLSDRAYFKEAMTGKSVFSNVIISRVTNSPVIILATPIKGFAGDVKGVLIARLDATLLSEISDNIKYGSTGYSYIIDDKGVLIAHGNRQFVLDQKNFLEEEIGRAHV